MGGQSISILPVGAACTTGIALKSQPAACEADPRPTSTASPISGEPKMRKLVVGTFLTLDGVMQAPGGPDEDRDGGFRHGGWMVSYFDDKAGKIMTEWIQRAGAFLLG